MTTSVILNWLINTQARALSAPIGSNCPDQLHLVGGSTPHPLLMVLGMTHKPWLGHVVLMRERLYAYLLPALIPGWISLDIYYSFGSSSALCYY